MGPLVDEKVDVHPIGQLTLLDRILSRKYSLPECLDGLPSTNDSERVKDKREGFSWISEEPHPMVEQAEVKPKDDQLSMVSVAGTDFSGMCTDDRAVKNAHTKKRRRFTGKAFLSEGAGSAR